MPLTVLLSFRSHVCSLYYIKKFKHVHACKCRFLFVSCVAQFARSILIHIISTLKEYVYATSPLPSSSRSLCGLCHINTKFLFLGTILFFNVVLCIMGIHLSFGLANSSVHSCYSMWISP